VAQQYDKGSAIHMATTLEIDAVIDPADTRAWLSSGLQAARLGPPATQAMVDTW